MSNLIRILLLFIKGISCLLYIVCHFLFLKPRFSFSFKLLCSNVLMMFWIFRLNAFDDQHHLHCIWFMDDFASLDRRFKLLWSCLSSFSWKCLVLQLVFLSFVLEFRVCFASKRQNYLIHGCLPCAYKIMSFTDAWMSLA